MCFVLGAGAGFLGAEVVVGGLDVYIRWGFVRLCCSTLSRVHGAAMIDLRAAS